MTIDLLFAGVAVADLDAAKAWYGRLFGRFADVLVSDDEVMWQAAGSGWRSATERVTNARPASDVSRAPAAQPWPKFQQP
jgi:hypothetical protein